MTERDPDLPRAARALALGARARWSGPRPARDLTLAQFRVLALVAAGDERSSLLAERLAVAKPTITAVVDGLVERGFVAREAVAGDRRSIRVALTPAGDVALRARGRRDGRGARAASSSTPRAPTRCSPRCSISTTRSRRACRPAFAESAGTRSTR